MIHIALGHLSYLSYPLLPLVLVEMMLCPHLYGLSQVVWVCICLFFLLNLVQCIAWVHQLTICLCFQTIGNIESLLSDLFRQSCLYCLMSSFLLFIFVKSA